MNQASWLKYKYDHRETSKDWRATGRIKTADSPEISHVATSSISTPKVFSYFRTTWATAVGFLVATTHPILCSEGLVLYVLVTMNHRLNAQRSG